MLGYVAALGVGAAMIVVHLVDDIVVLGSVASLGSEDIDCYWCCVLGAVAAI